MSSCQHCFVCLHCEFKLHQLKQDCVFPPRSSSSHFGLLSALTRSRIEARGPVFPSIGGSSKSVGRKEGAGAERQMHGIWRVRSFASKWEVALRLLWEAAVSAGTGAMGHDSPGWATEAGPQMLVSS